METRLAKCGAKATGSLDGKRIDGMVDLEQSGKLIISCLTA